MGEEGILRFWIFFGRDQELEIAGDRED